MKSTKLAGCLMTAFLLFSSLLFFPGRALAAGEGNMETGGSHFGTGDSQNFWSNGNDGVRVTIVKADDGTAMTTPIDLTNTHPTDIVVHFNKTCKTSYRSGSSLTPNTGTYVYYNPEQMLPTIISSGHTNSEQIKSYFTDEGILRNICSITGFDYDVLIGGDYKVLVEPVAYMTFLGLRTAVSATDAALYNELLGGTMRTKMPSLTHKNLPLAIFLERSDLGFPAWTGSTTERVTDDDIISSLGLGIVKFTDEPSPELDAYDYIYRVDTDVITSVTVSGGQSDPDDSVDVSFNINGTTYTATNVYYPEDSSQLAWVRWHTPATPQIITINITASGSGVPGTATIRAKVVDLDGNDPPNPTADDRNDRYNAANAIVPVNAENNAAAWSIWRPVWAEDWVWHSDWVWVEDECEEDCEEDCEEEHGHWTDEGDWVDEGEWEFYRDYYRASMTAGMTLTPDAKSPTATSTTIKSGYGVNICVASEVQAIQVGWTDDGEEVLSPSSEAAAAVTGTQTAVSYFPEFYYRTYWRLLEGSRSGLSTDYQFKPNPYSTYNRRTHFTPIWMKDGSYTVYTYVMDCWTPCGMLSVNLTDGITISGDLWKDWHIAPKN